MVPTHFLNIFQNSLNFLPKRLNLYQFNSPEFLFLFVIEDSYYEQKLMRFNHNLLSCILCSKKFSLNLTPTLHWIIPSCSKKLSKLSFMTINNSITIQKRIFEAKLISLDIHWLHPRYLLQKLKLIYPDI